MLIITTILFSSMLWTNLPMMYVFGSVPFSTFGCVLTSLVLGTYEVLVASGCNSPVAQAKLVLCSF